MFQRFAKLFKQLKQYPRLGDKLLSLYNILLVSRKLSWVPLPGRRRPVNVFVRGHAFPFAVRLGSTDWLVLVEIFLDGEYEEVGKLFSDSRPATIIDLGANAGFSVRYWLEIYPAAYVYAVEPDAENCAMIQRNIALCCSDKLSKVVQACIVGQPRDNVLFETASGREWAYSITNTASPTARKVRAITMETLITECAITGSIDLLKCDIEGGEVDLFEHCGPWIHRIGGAVVEVHGSLSVENLLNGMREKGINFSHRLAAKSDLCLFKMIPIH